MTAPDSTPSSDSDGLDFPGAHEPYNNLDSPYPEAFMKRAAISVDPRTVLRWAKTHSFGVPDDAEFRSAWYDFDLGCFRIGVTSESFHNVPEGDIAPTIVTITEP